LRNELYILKRKSRFSVSITKKHLIERYFEKVGVSKWANPTHTDWFTASWVKNEWVNSVHFMVSQKFYNRA